MILLLRNWYDHAVNESNHLPGLLRFPTYVLGKLHKALHVELDSPLREHWVLVYLADRDEQPTQQEMAEELAIDRSEVVRLVDGLEENGLVSRSRDPDDRRKYRLAVTEAGRRRRQRVDTEIELATDTLFHRLSPAERDTLHRLALKALGYDDACRHPFLSSTAGEDEGNG
jgi:DNA-binding MarR family transcriptional regulator